MLLLLLLLSLPLVLLCANNLDRGFDTKQVFMTAGRSFQHTTCAFLHFDLDSFQGCFFAAPYCLPLAPSASSFVLSAELASPRDSVGMSTHIESSTDAHAEAESEVGWFSGDAWSLQRDCACEQ